MDSKVIRDYGILNDSIAPGDAFLYGIPYPGVYACDAEGRVIRKFFHDTYKKRDSAEIYLDAALGRLRLRESEIRDQRADDEVRIQLALRGGKGSIRQGIIRQLLLRFELTRGLHIYGEPVPEGMIPLQIEVKGPDGLVVESPELPPARELHLTDMDVKLQVWSGSFDVCIPFYPTGELASETRPLDAESATISVSVRYQACNEATCLLPKTETFELELPLDVVDVPHLALHLNHGQREGSYNAMGHALRLLRRKVLPHPIGFIRYLISNRKLARAARKRMKTGA